MIRLDWRDLIREIGVLMTMSAVMVVLRPDPLPSISILVVFQAGVIYGLHSGRSAGWTR